MGCSVSLEIRAKDLDRVKEVFHETGVSVGSSFEDCFEEFLIEGSSVYMYSDWEKYGLRSEAKRMKDAGIPFIRVCGADDFDAGMVEVFDGGDAEMVFTNDLGQPVVSFDPETGEITQKSLAKRFSKLYNRVRAIINEESVDTNETTL